MHQPRLNKAPDYLDDAFKRRLAFIASSRIRLMLPVLAFLLIYFLIRSFTGYFGGDELDNYTFVDGISLVVIVLFGTVYYVYDPREEEEIRLIHIILQRLFAMIIIFWGATVTRISVISAGGGATLIICLLITSSLLLVELRYFLIICAGAAVIIIAGNGLSPNHLVEDYLYQDLFLLGIAFVLSLIINFLSIEQVLKAFVLEHKLEDEVERRTKELSEETEKAQRSDQLKTVFLANMSHEIRTPLNGILGFANLLRDERLKPETRREYVDIVLRSGNTLLDILNGIIEVARIESDEVELYTEEFSLNDLVHETLSGFRGHEKIRSDAVSLVNNVEGSEPLFIITDRLKLIQILMNLVNNAVKYTDEGVISVCTEVNGTEVLISVEDTGRGIKEEDRQIIFDRFQQTETAAYSPTEGVGLGLTIVKAYTELLSGEILLESVYGSGSKFTLRLPLNINE